MPRRRSAARPGSGGAGGAGKAGPARRSTPLDRELKRSMRGRPLWHRGAGFLTAVAGVGLIIVNYAEELGSTVLPGGHQELYFALGIVIALCSSWWFGLFDRPAGSSGRTDGRR